MLHSQSYILEVLLLLVLVVLENRCCEALGSMKSIAISSGETPMVCAIQASKEQEVLCWGRNASFIEQSSLIPPLMGLSGGSGFMCGLQTGVSTPFCFTTNFTTGSNSSSGSSTAAAALVPNTVPPPFLHRAYSMISAGRFNVCALGLDQRSLDCWSHGADPQKQIHMKVENSTLEQVEAGDGYFCTLDRLGVVSCWGEMNGSDDSSSMNTVRIDQEEVRGLLFDSISAGAAYVCGIEKSSGEARCWGSGSPDPPKREAFSELAAGSDHTCGILKATHEVQCWGSVSGSFRTELLTLASGPGISCGVREGNLLADCWGTVVRADPGTVPEYAPPPELFSPGICRREIGCPLGFFAFNASSHGVPEAEGGICGVGRRICAPCASGCPPGMFLSSGCGAAEDRICVGCSVCEEGEEAEGCSGRCTDLKREERWQRRRSILILVGVSSCFVFLLLVLVALRVRRMLLDPLRRRRKSPPEQGSPDCGGKDHPGAVIIPSEVQVFRLADLRDATSGFKEMNEIGRGRYGAVYKAVLPDGTQLAVKRASAARRIQFTNKEFESELETLCKMRHENLVNLIGHCDQMGERLLASEFMVNGSLFDHLHAENGTCKPHSCPVATRWGIRLSIAAQAARGLAFLHSSKPPVVHGNLNSCNVMLDREWNARISDFGFLGAGRASFESGYGVGGVISDSQPTKAKVADDVYSFGVVMLELLSGRKAVIGGVFDPPVRLVDWAVQMIERGKLESLVDVQCSGETLMHSSSKQGLIRFAEIAGVCVGFRSEREGAVTRMGEVAEWLQELVLQQQQQHHHHYHMPSPNIPCINVRGSYG